MRVLATDLRNRLKDAVVAARNIAEAGCRTALEALAVHHHEPYGHMSSEERSLRKKLRAHARQLGDCRDPNSGSQEINQLVSECAYEHWHRMLFARYLAENHLLIEPETGVAISLEECEELAREEGLDTWTLAGHYAEKMLPQIFRPNDPLLQVKLARNHQLPLNDILKKLAPDTFTASDSLGWVYQFWQTKKKEEVNQAEVKIGANELPAVTQLFTEPYMVSFLLDNSLGAWWAAQKLLEDDLKNAKTEKELRNKASLPGVPLDYLRFVRQKEGAWAPAANTFDSWPKCLKDFKTIDPCCGSGHFLNAAFLMLVPMRMELEGLSAREAVNKVLSENIYGLELDQRCVELAAFNLALNAWKYPGAVGYRPLPELNLACSGLSISAEKEDWMALACDNKNLSLGLGELYNQFKNAPVLGSLINPGASLSRGSLFELKWEDIGPLLSKALKEKKDEEKIEMGVVAKGHSRAAQLLADSYHLVMTNVPFLGRGKQTDIQKNYCDSFFEDAKSDLSTSMLRRCLDLCRSNGTAVLVTPQVWLFQNSYSKLRSSILSTHTWNLISKLGANAFQDMNWWAAVTLLSIISSFTPKSGHIIYGLDVGNTKDRNEKANLLQKTPIESSTQTSIRRRPNSVVVFSDSTVQTLLCDSAKSTEGLSTGDGSQFLCEFWEHPKKSNQWDFFHSTPREKVTFGGMSQMVYWEQGRGILSTSEAARIQGHNAWHKEGVLLSRMNKLVPAIYLGNLFDKMAVVIISDKKQSLPAIWAYVSSSSYHDDVRALSQNVAVATKTLAQVPFDLEHWAKVAEEKYPHGLPQPYSDDPTQWIFHGHPCGSVVWSEENKRLEYGPYRTDETVLQVAVARLLGYRWPAELDPEMELAEEQREWVQKCDALLELVDEDGIVPIPSLRGEEPAAERLQQMLTAAYTSAGAPASFILHPTSFLDDWLRNSFFEAHCKLFQHRPFIWHIWDGRKRDGFHALVNYHKLAEGNGKGRQLLEKLTYGYLGDWIILQKDGVKQGTSGAEDRLTAALELGKRLKAILEGEPPFDIFVRWKPLHQQPINWKPDINDGVRLNIRPFMTDDIPGGKRGAGILRWKPNIKWTKDRGKDVSSAPWYDLGPRYGGKQGDRINDHHLTIAEKREARERQKAAGERIWSLEN